MKGHAITPSAGRKFADGGYTHTVDASSPLALQEPPPRVQFGAGLAAMPNCKFFLELEDGHVLRYDAAVPFLPVAGMAIDPGSGDTFKVKDVCYICRTGELWVDLVEEAFQRNVGFYVRHGWLIEDQPA
jgi:hypothetical protein